MNSQGVSGPEAGGKTWQRRLISGLLLFLCAVAAVVRAAVGYNGGIWADEGFFLLVVGSPSWRAMVDFLRFHESHPPLFYALMRVWRHVFGTGDAVALILPLIIGVAIVPVIFFCGSRLFSWRVGLIAAALSAISPSLVEHSSQLRPYGLLPLLTLVSCYALIVTIARGGVRYGLAYVVSTALLLYTHNWSWLVVLGQVAAVASLFAQLPTIQRSRVARDLILCWTAVGIAYLPWLTTLLYQAQHAGHPPIFVDGWVKGAELAMFAIPSAFVMVLFGGISAAGSGVWLAASAFVLAAGAFLWATLSAVAVHQRGNSRDSLSSEYSSIAIRILIVVPAAAIIGAIALSWRTNLLIPRCLAMLTPLVLLIIAQWFEKQRLSSRMGAGAALGVTVLAGVVVVSIVSVVSLMNAPRSNVREVASAIARKDRPSDMVILVPEWYAASFNHYFPPSVEQIDYPHAGRSGAVDFADVYKRVADPAPVVFLRGRIDEARRQGKRVWLVTGRSYVRSIDARDFAAATRYRQSPMLSAMRVGQIQHYLQSRYGAPDTSSFIGGRKPRYDEILAYLYSPVAAGPIPAGLPAGR